MWESDRVQEHMLAWLMNIWQENVKKKLVSYLFRYLFKSCELFVKIPLQVM